MWKHLHVKHPLLLSEFNETSILWTDFRKSSNVKSPLCYCRWCDEAYEAERATYSTQLSCFSGFTSNSHSLFHLFLLSILDLFQLIFPIFSVFLFDFFQVSPLFLRYFYSTFRFSASLYFNVLDLRLTQR